MVSKKTKLTIKEIEILVSNPSNIFEYENGVYDFETENGTTLVENNKILCQYIESCHWYKKGVYEYKTKAGITLIENGKVLVENMEYCYWYSRGIYKYKPKFHKMIRVGY